MVKQISTSAPSAALLLLADSLVPSILSRCKSRRSGIVRDEGGRPDVIFCVCIVCVIEKSKDKVAAAVSLASLSHMVRLIAAIVVRSVAINSGYIQNARLTCPCLPVIVTAYSTLVAVLVLMSPSFMGMNVMDDDIRGSRDIVMHLDSPPEENATLYMLHRDEKGKLRSASKEKHNESETIVNITRTV